MATRNIVSLTVARIIPAFVTLLLGYLSYVVVGSLSINYLINAPDGVDPRVEAGIAIILLYFFFLIPAVTCWIRLITVLLGNPGFEPEGDAEYENLQYSERPGMERFYKRDVFVCDYRGLPKWCEHCHNWKSDRTHHNQDTGRCVLKMDHFCPWVGGVVGERSYKFFVQFQCYATLLTTFSIIVLGCFISETRDYVNWMIAVGIASFFTLFMLGMIGNSLWLTFQNLTAIENMDRGPMGRNQFLAVLLPPQLQNGPEISRPEPARTRSSRSERKNAPGQASSSDPDDSTHWRYFEKDEASDRLRNQMNLVGTITYPLQEPDTTRPPLPAPITRRFAIIQPLRSTNIFHLGSAYRNFTSVFGERLHDWLLPIKKSPCCDHSDVVSMYSLGPQFEQLLVDSGLIQPPRGKVWEGAPATHSGAKKTRRPPRGWENGERPPGWEVERAARRQRR